MFWRRFQDLAFGCCFLSPATGSGPRSGGPCPHFTRLQSGPFLLAGASRFQQSLELFNQADLEQLCFSPRITIGKTTVELSHLEFNWQQGIRFTLLTHILSSQFAGCYRRPWRGKRALGSLWPGRSRR